MDRIGDLVLVSKHCLSNAWEREIFPPWFDQVAVRGNEVWPDRNREQEMLDYWRYCL